MSNSQWVTMAQISFKAGKVQFGSRLIPAIQNQSVVLVLVSESCGNNTKKKLRNKCQYYGVDLMEVNHEEFSSINSRLLSAIGITDKKFAQSIKESLKKVGENNGL